MLRRTAGHALDLLDVQRQGGADEPRERRDLLAHGVAPGGAGVAAAARLSFARALVRQRGAEPRRPRASRSWARLMSSSSAQSCMLDGGEDGADAERLRASERAVVALAIANWTVWTDAANGSPADRASADVSAVARSRVRRRPADQRDVHAGRRCRRRRGGDPRDGGRVADHRCRLVSLSGSDSATVARASTVAMAQGHATMGSLLFACLSGELAPPNVSMVLADRSRLSCLCRSWLLCTS